MCEIPGWWVMIAAAIGGMLAGALLCGAWVSRAARMRRRIPKHWPLSSRTLANSAERKVWSWLCGAFSEHHIMLKTPVTRFTLPRSREQGTHWYQLLSGVYCTLTVCTPEGRVIGCIDVPGNKHLSRRNRQLKQTLLPQCGVTYWVIESGNLPTRAEIRSAFLGVSEAPARPTELDETIIIAARMKLRASLDSQRQGRHSDLAPLVPGTVQHSDKTFDIQLHTDSGFSSCGAGLHQDNSFLAPLDSRHSKIY